MLSRRNNRGFTMMETLVVTAIVVILMGVAFVAVQNYQRSMKQFELDKTAREIFVAAQNHLTVAESQGLLTTRERKEEIVGVQRERVGETYHYFVVGSDYSQLDGQTVLRDMLPPFSIDDTVRLGGSYVIEYNLESATVTNVFYSDGSERSNLSAHEFSSVDLEALFDDQAGYVGNGKSALRLEGFGGERNAIIGWYGGDDAKDLARVTLHAPKVELINAERLQLKISFTRNAITRMTRDADTKPEIRVIIKGKTSGNERCINLLGNTANDFPTVNEFNASTKTFNEVNGVVAYRSYLYTLDDVTRRDEHFANQLDYKHVRLCGGDNPLIPGEDITITVKVVSTTVLSNIPEAEAGPTNSLFGWTGEKKTGVALIANFRHIENLDPAISGYDLEALRNAGGAPATKAEQVKSLAKNSDEEDLSWEGFKKAIDNSAPENVRVYKLQGDASGDVSKPGTYMPINPEYQKNGNAVYYLESYDGKGLSIEGVKADNASSAGLFGSLNSCAVSNLELRSFNVQTSNGNAGALVGTGNGLTITNVLARNTVSDDSGLEIKGPGSTGGLVGQASDTKIEASAAALYVRSTAGSAGGLVGSITGNSNIKNSYAGGHTKDGKYLSETNGEARINVQAATNAGGLVGEASFASGDVKRIENCYATTSVHGSSLAGGLIGNASGGKIENCYATGLVAAGASGKAGAFAGSLTDVTVSGGKYFSIINENVDAIPNTNVSGITAFDATIQDYNAFFRGTEVAYPYDSALTKLYQNMYSFQTVKQLSDSNNTMTGFVTTHYGDWPAPEVLVVNEPNA